jgi:hypothetical protein
MSTELTRVGKQIPVGNAHRPDGLREVTGCVACPAARLMYYFTLNGEGANSSIGSHSQNILARFPARRVTGSDAGGRAQ